MQHHPAIVERSVGIQCYLLEYVIRKWCKCTGCLYTGQIPIVLLSIAKNGYKLLLSLYPGHLARWICSSFCQKVGLFTYPLNVSWPCGLIWPTARGRSLDVSVPRSPVWTSRGGAHFHSLSEKPASPRWASPDQLARRWDATWWKGMVPWPTINQTPVDLIADSRHSRAQAKLLTTEPNKQLMF